MAIEKIQNPYKLAQQKSFSYQSEENLGDPSVSKGFGVITPTNKKLNLELFSATPMKRYDERHSIEKNVVADAAVQVAKNIASRPKKEEIPAEMKEFTPKMPKRDAGKDVFVKKSDKPETPAGVKFLTGMGALAVVAYAAKEAISRFRNVRF